MLQKGAFLERQETGPGRRDKALAFYILGGKVRMAGEVLEVALSVVEYERGKFVYNVVDNPLKQLQKKRDQKHFTAGKACLRWSL